MSYKIEMEVGNGNFQCKYYIFNNVILNNIIIDLQTSSEIWETDPDMTPNLTSPFPMELWMNEDL